MIDIETKKKELFCVLDDIEEDVKTLSLWIMRARQELELVSTEKDAKIFDERNGDIENSLVHLRIF